MSRFTKTFIFLNNVFSSLLHMFLPPCYLQKIFDEYVWFLVYIVATVLMDFSVIDFLQVLLLSFSFSFSLSPFPKVCSMFSVNEFFP